ncbi:MAG: phosphoenolpyruvate carboxykinase [Omnitrophica bacterium RIFCSPHIGHO2_02_FULL_51_18]|nr:MAG: phosphoenolpyruvate carboxykinase [Omnitrophica bacterium RIFCSPHIGHO2_02_FULL_51_18]
MKTEEQKLTTNSHLVSWVREMAELCRPDAVVWCDGSEAERKRLTQESLAISEIIELNQEKMPGCYLHRSNPNDVARTEHLTFICTQKKEDVGPTNNWMEPREAYRKLGGIFSGSMRGRKMYVIPFIMGPARSSSSKVGVQITDSIYVVLNMRIMTRMGKIALDQLGQSNDFTRCLHGKADLDINRRFICHFPEDNTIWSVGSAYGGNALLGKKCLALRIGSFLGRRQGWMAEHMLILGIQNPKGEIHYVSAAFPSQCGKTNLAMMIPPQGLAAKGYKVWTVGDDIAWLRPGPDGRLWAINPEAGFFGVAVGTGQKSNPNALKTIQKNTLFTNVVLTKDKTVWWEGFENPPAEGIDWKGKPWTLASGEKGAHPNSRFTAPASQCPCISPEWENPKGVPISAMFFGGRRAKVAPLIYETLNWQHGTYVGATMASETTAAATGAVGVVRRDPMAMLPFCGYNMGDYFGHWLSIGKKIAKPPKIFHVNWFKTDSQGKFLWPGFGENLRVLLWAIERVEGAGKAKQTPIGNVPTADAIDLTGLDISKEKMEYLLEVDRAEWEAELDSQNEFFDKFAGRLPKEIISEQEALRARLKK